MYKGVIFDLDNTLYDYETINELAMNSLKEYSCSILKITEEQFKVAFKQARESTKINMADCAAQHNRIIYCQKTLEYLGRKPTSYALEMYEVYWGTMLDKMELNKGVLEIFQKLKELEVKIAICTDLTAHIQHRKIRKLGLQDYIDVLVTSEEAGCEKPNSNIFKLCLEKMNMNPDEVLYVGDSFSKDIVGANSVGIKPIWFNPSGEKQELFKNGIMQIGSFEQLLIWELLNE